MNTDRDTARVRGQRLKSAIHVAREQAGITSDMALSEKADVHYDTLMNWYSGKTTPRPSEVKKVADVVAVSYGDLLAAYEGREPAAVPLEQAVAELIAEIRSSVLEDRRARAEFMRAITATLAGAISPPAPVPTMDVPPANRPAVGNGAGR